jgi:putative sterol carrier protein
MEFLSEQWMERYRQLWNADPELVAGLSGFTAWIEYGWENDDKPSVFLRVENGHAKEQRAGHLSTKPDFVMKASAENWQRLRDGSLSGRAALLTKKLKFQGSMITAMKYMNPFNRSIELIGKV